MQSIVHSASDDASFEIIIVNDGSVDCTDSLCHELCREYSEIRYFAKENEGVSVARNFGLEKAIGEFICFVDADDTVAPDYLMSISAHARHSDITFFGFRKCIVSTGDSMELIPKGKRPEMDRSCMERIMASLLSDCAVNFLGFTWSKVFKAEIIRKHRVRFNPLLKIKEDEIFTFEYCRHISSLQVLDRALYNYNIFEGSLSHSHTHIRYDILSAGYGALARSFDERHLRDKLYGLSVSYGLGHARDMKRAKISRQKVTGLIDSRIVPLVAAGHGVHSTRWMPYINKYLPKSLMADAIYLMLR